jgi:hypothetical protein
LRRPSRRIGADAHDATGLPSPEVKGGKGPALERAGAGIPDEGPFVMACARLNGLTVNYCTPGTRFDMLVFFVS